MIFIIKYGKIFLFSLFLISCSGFTDKSGNEQKRDIIVNAEISAFRDSVPDYSLNADTVIVFDDSLIMTGIDYIRQNDSTDIQLLSDSLVKISNTLIFSGNVKVHMEDSMILYTARLYLYPDSNIVRCYDSLLIEKLNDKMKTKGFISDMDFLKIEFMNPLIMYNE
ncbi:hypothetical protein KAU15_06580 [candidate division WOR-3 bacterium]|nr:hypothetical protein [candidate division WOR-3 bacterium]